MTYNEWRDELKNNLLSVPDEERRRVLDYYAEAYADRREAGSNECAIIAEFGAPYDAAQKILGDGGEKLIRSQSESHAYTPSVIAPTSSPTPTTTAIPQSAVAENPIRHSSPINKLLIVPVITLACLPMTGVLGVILCIFALPFICIGAGIQQSIGMIVAFSCGEGAYGTFALGTALIAAGLGIAALPLLPKLAKTLKRHLTRLTDYIGSRFGDKERAA